MKAIQIRQTGLYDALQYVDVETPSPGEGRILVRTVAASVNFADTMIRKGTYPVMPPLPLVPGFECSGFVEAVGEKVTQIRQGQPVIVFSSQCYAEFVLADARSVFPIPEQVNLEEAAAIPVVYLTAFHLLHTVAGVHAGQTILVYGASGGVGTAIVQLAKRAGLRVIGLTSSEEKVRFAKKQGFDHIINYQVEDVAQRVREVTRGRGVHFILNSVAGDTFSRDFGMLDHFGQVIWFGFSGGPPQGDLKGQLLPHLGKSVGIRFFSLESIFQKSPSLVKDTLDELIRDLSEKRITPHIHERLPLQAAPRAHELLESGAVMGKVILKPFS